MPKELTDTQTLFLEFLEKGMKIKDIAAQMDISMSYAYEMSSNLKEVIHERTRDRLALAGLHAANTVVDLISSDGSTEKGELRLKAAESVLDRTGVTKHTNVDVQVEAENGIFILPGKSIVPPAKPEDTSD